MIQLYNLRVIKIWNKLAAISYQKKSWIKNWTHVNKYFGWNQSHPNLKPWFSPLWPECSPVFGLNDDIRSMDTPSDQHSPHFQLSLLIRRLAKALRMSWSREHVSLSTSVKSSNKVVFLGSFPYCLYFGKHSVHHYHGCNSVLLVVVVKILSYILLFISVHKQSFLAS